MRYALIGALVLTGCDDGDCCKTTRADAATDAVLAQDANTTLIEVALVPAAVNRDIDLLVVVDDSGGMLDKQQRLRANFSAFLDEITTPAAGGAGDPLTPTLPSLHLGVITTDMGTRAADGSVGPAVSTCSGSGKDGLMQIGTAPVTGRYLIDVAASSGGRMTNYSGSLVEAFGQMASVGNQGCPFEQPLAAIDRALANPANAGFVRPEARLAILLVTDDDDCSVSSSAIFTEDTGALGSLTSFRCTRFGVTCDVGGRSTDEMNMPGSKAGCRSNDASLLLTDVQRYARRVGEMKTTRRDVLFASIAGPVTPVNVGQFDFLGGPTSALLDSCTYDGANGTEMAFPAVRIGDFSALLPNTSRFSICSGFYSILRQFALRVRELMGTSTCLAHAILLPASCEGVDVAADDTETVIPACTSPSATSCLRIVQAPDECSTVQALKVEIVRSTPVPASTWTSVRCAI